MSDAPMPPEPAARLHGLLLMLGIGFAVLWIVGHIIWGAVALLGSLMANDSGAASSGQHMALIGGMLGGQVTSGAAGIPGGLAFFWSGKRKWFGLLFAVLVITGVAWQWFAFQSFSSTAASH